ncbi:hypothetical protein BIWAKO_04949 [Bosea sp. BIWAKO-01]|nr:hypothetical protein BIWAKO_04949 [Bosea sp. BIWAKO-01]
MPQAREHICLEALDVALDKPDPLRARRNCRLQLSKECVAVADRQHKFSLPGGEAAAPIVSLLKQGKPQLGIGLAEADFMNTNVARLRKHDVRL